VTLTGTVRPRRVLTRGTGRPGHGLYVTGSVGAAFAGLLWLQQHPSLDQPPDAMAECVRRYRRPDARLRVGQLAARTRAASACMDLSDGLADAVRQVAEASGTGARIDGEAIPLSPAAAAVFLERGHDPVHSAVAGGDDYELLFAVPPRRRRAFESLRGLARGVSITRIGELTQDPALVLNQPTGDEALPEGFSHF
jgi:thiamine-monophosphate kinase